VIRNSIRTGVYVLITAVSGLLAFKGIMKVDDVYAIVAWSFGLIGFPGFVFHMIAVRKQLKDRRPQKSEHV